MIDHDLNKKGASGQTLFKMGPVPDEIEKKLRDWMRKNKHWNKSKTITPKQVAANADISEAYVFYDFLSSDAHPTFAALYRYFPSEAGKEITDIDLDPEPSGTELAQTLALGCYGLVNVLVCWCKICKSGADKKVDALAREYLELMQTINLANDVARQQQKATTSIHSVIPHQ